MLVKAVRDGDLRLLTANGFNILKVISITLSMLMVFSCYAYKIYEIESLTQESLSLKEATDVRLPAKSQATPGTVTRHKTDSLAFSNTIFIIGGDADSKNWLVKHLDVLKKYQAIGFITNIKDHQQFEALQALAGLPLLPANIDDLLNLIGSSHYPLIVYQGEVWQ